MTLQQQIITELKVLPTIDAQEEIQSIDFLKAYAQKYV
ncbi:NH(3)-dependent NAD(+) synthetase OS=Lysinibacillus sphaericus OX=1421 GN=nadE PE=3 SV=1 [Lysinibacillus sphaericus]